MAAAGLNCSRSSTAADAVAALRRLLDIHHRHRASQSLIERTMTVWWHVLIGDMDAARGEITEVVRECREAGASGALPRALVINGVTEFHKGRWSDAEAFAANAVEIGGELDQQVWLQFARAQVLGPIAALRGQTSRVRELTESAEDGPEGPICTAGPLLDFSMGRYESALEGYAAILESEVPGDAITHVPTAVEAAVRAGSRSAWRASSTGTPTGRPRPANRTGRPCSNAAEACWPKTRPRPGRASRAPRNCTAATTSSRSRPRAPTSYWANGCAGHAASTRPRPDCALPWRSSSASARRRGSNGSAPNCAPPGTPARSSPNRAWPSG
ncbi:hypothetical protein GCM10029992_10740 [Glycomyces albus]